MIITVSALNQLENKYTPNGLGVEIINENELTYNKVNTAVNNGILPILKIEITVNSIVETYFYILSSYYTSDNTRRAIFSEPDGMSFHTFAANSDSAIMTHLSFE